MRSLIKTVKETVMKEKAQSSGPSEMENPSFVQAEALTVINLQPGELSTENMERCDHSKMPSIACPIFACLFAWPLGIGAVVYYLRAQSAQGNCHSNLK